MVAPVTVLIASRNRPLYLWACLDALYRTTRAPSRFILVDMGSTDPLVFDVVEGFERRGMLNQVVKLPYNDSNLLLRFAYNNLLNWSPYFAYIESDVVVQTEGFCWLERMSGLMEGNPRLAMLGAAIDKSDFISPDDFPHLLDRFGQARWNALIKYDSPERQQDTTSTEEALFRPHNPAGRFLLLRSDALAEIGLMDDRSLDNALRARGWDTAISTEISHRHLSLIQAFDYPEYDLAARDRYMTSRLDP